MDRNPEFIFYDGYCGLCHRAVRIAVHADRAQNHFRFAPLGGETFRSLLPEPQRAGLPDSFVLLTSDGRLLVRSMAQIYLWRKLGWVWRWLSVLFEIVPGGWRDAFYDFIARHRSRWFARQENICPLLPRDLQDRFLP